MKNLFLLTYCFSVILFSNAFAQPDLSYYLPENIEYDVSIPKPKQILGHEVGELHVSHDKLVAYMYALDQASDRISLEVMGYTHELRPLLLLTITSPENHKNLETIRKDHLKLTDPAVSGSMNVQNMPGVFYMGCSIHGNEPSGSNAGLLFAYHMAAGKGPAIENALKNTIILFDPSFNPDGLHRFSSWVNSRKSKAISADSYDMEHNEPWPGGRTNHYWFDLNRDWLVAQQPESQARIRKFHAWRPNLLTDHHEMGTNSTFFFQPGVPARMHPITPLKNLELTKKMGEYHAKALDAIGSLYFTQEGYDDFYYGKGSTFPDAQGAVGILFEQASSRGHAQESTNGVVKFPFTIRNQFTTALSSLESIVAMREEFLNYQRQFFRDAVAEAAKDPVKGIVFGSALDKGRVFLLAEIVARQNVNIYRPSSPMTINGKTYDQSNSYIIPFNQPQYKLIKGMFERRTKFADSLFYDISSWTLSLAAGVDHEELKTMPALGERVETPTLPEGKFIGTRADYAYAFEPHGYYTPRAINRLLQNGIRIKVATDPFYHNSGKKLDRGTIVIPLGTQEKTSQFIEYEIKRIMKEDGFDVYGFTSGLDYQGTSLGSSSFLTVRKPEIAVLVDVGVSANDAGEIWHLLDTRYQVPVTMIPVNVFNNAALSKYNTIILPPGTYNAINDQAKERLKGWVQNGGVLIGLENALNWLNANGIGKFEMKKAARDSSATKPYALIEQYQGAQETSGAIFEAKVDLTNPLLFGYYNATMPIFKSNNLFMTRSKNPYGNPIAFGRNALLSGYISKQNYSKLHDSAVAGVSVMGRGRVIGFTDNLAFRAFWFGSNKILMNAIYYGSLINEAAAR